MVEDCQVPSVMKQSVTHKPCCRSDVTRAMHPVRIGFVVRRSADMKMNVASVGMLN
jgi:hypothetical protein